MHSILLLAEDLGHERVLTALVSRLASDRGIAVSIKTASALGGRGRLQRELGAFVRDIRTGKRSSPDVLIVCTDANCKGEKWRDEVQGALKDYMGAYVTAIPDPHVERWLLLDSAAFKAVLGQGCRAPDAKCEKSRYKQWLARSVQAAGFTPEYGGLEFAEDIVNAMDLQKLEIGPDRSLSRFLKDLRTCFNQWT